MRSGPWRPLLGNTPRACCWRACGQRWTRRDAALADFRAALELARPQTAPAGSGPIAVPAHQALHNLEQLIYLEQVDNLAPGTLLPAPPNLREMAQRKLNQVLDRPAARSPRFPWAASTVGSWPIRRS
jgi:hypothetical protein